MEWTFALSSPQLNQDILDNVFAYGPLDKTLSSAAMVCRMWAESAQAALYRELFFFPLDNRPRDQLLARTMRTCPHLRRLVRRLSLITLWTHAPMPELCDWIPLLPAQCLHEFQWTWIRGHIIPTLVDSPAIRTVSRIQLRGRFYSTDKLQPILELPYLESLSLELSGQEQGDIRPVASSRLTTLSVYFSVEYGPVFDKLLAAVGLQLAALEVTHKICYDVDDGRALVSAIESCCPNLKRLSFTATFMDTNSYPILDHLICRYDDLEHLCCSEGTYTSALFERLPSTLNVLELYMCGTSFDHEAALLKYIAHAPTGRHGLATVMIASKGHRSRYQSVGDACRARGVEFRYNQDGYCAG